MIFLKEKIYQNDILCVYDSSLCLGMGECLFLFDAFHRDSSCLSLSSLYPQDPPIFQLSSPPIENSELYIYADFRFTIFMTFKICILCINEQNVYKTFQGKTISGGDNKAWYLFRISEKIILIDCKDTLVEGKRTGFKI